jgi:hypothetical protein
VWSAPLETPHPIGIATLGDAESTALARDRLGNLRV